MKSTPHILATDEKPLAILKLRNPGKINAINEEMARELISLIKECDQDSSCMAIIIGGDGGNFSSGADIEGFSGRGPEGALAFHALLNEVVRAIRSCAKPVIAVLEGYSLGGGLEIAESCDMRIASEDAKIGQPEINIGINAGAGGNVVLPKLVGRGRALYMILTGRKLSAKEAVEFGLVDFSFPAGSVWKEVRNIALEIASKPPATVRLAKMLVNNSEDMSVNSALDFEAVAFSMLFSTDETKKRIQKFLNGKK